MRTFPKITLYTTLSFFGGLFALLGAAFLFRESLVRLGANHFLADQQIYLTRLQGLQVSSDHAALAELELQLPTGLRLVISDLAVDFSFTNLASAPVVESLVLGSAQLLGAAEEDNSADDSGALLLTDFLQLLREFPVARVVINDLTVPQWPETVVLDLQHNAGELSLNLDSGALHLLAHFTQADAAAAALLQVTLTRGAGTVGAFGLTLQPDASGYDLAGNGNLEIPDLNALLGELQQDPLALPLKAASLNWDLAGAIADDLRGVSRNSTPMTFVLGVAAASTVALPADPAQDLGDLVVVFNDRAELTVTTGAGAGISTGRLPLGVAGSWQQQPFNINTVLTLADCRLAAAAACNIGFDGSADFATYTLSGAIRVAAPDLDAGMAGNYQIHTEGLELGGLPAWLPPFDIEANLVVAEDTLTFNTPLLLRNTPADAGITTSGSYDLASGAVTVQLAVPQLEFIEAGRPLSAWLGEWPYSFDVLSGSLTSELELQWQTGVITGNMTATLEEVGGFYGDIFFRGLSGNLQASIDTTAAFTFETPPLALTVAGIDVGLPLENLAVDFRFDRDSQQLLISSFSAEALGGTVTAADVNYDFSRARNDITVLFTGLQLENMLTLVEYEGVEAIGAVSGELPLTFTANGVEVAAGTLHADIPGGSIRYLDAATAVAGNNAGLNLMNQALGNYQFESLASSIDYTPDGELLLSMRLQGHNPDMNNGQRINLNLNLSDNIPALLKSLQAARAIEDFLGEQYK